MPSQIDLEQELRELGRTLVVAPPPMISLSGWSRGCGPRARAVAGCRPGGTG
jgi:hypothetical protein